VLLAGTAAALPAPGFTELVSLSTADVQVIVFASRSSTFVPETQPFFAYDIFARDMPPQADLPVAMNDSPDPIPARDQLTYTVTVRNDGPAGATGATLVDTLPDAVFVSATPTQGNCVRQGKGNSDSVLTCELGPLAAGGTATVTIVVSPPRAGTITNTASVRANEPDPDRADNTATQTTTVLPR